MCGRYVLASSREELLDIFQIGVDEAQPVLPSFNIAPSQEVAIVVQPEARRLEPARWGFVPSYAKSLTSGPTPFNARDDKVLTSGMYKAAFAKHRAIFPADGFYERRKTGERQSFYIHPLDSKILAIAGFYGWWRQPGIEGAPWLLTATMVTRPAQGKMVGIHDREPLYLPKELWADWLDQSNTTPATLLAHALAASAEVEKTLEYRPVGPAWLATRGSKRRDGPELIERVG